MATKTKTKRSLRPDFISWSKHTESVRGHLVSMSWQDMKNGAVPKYTLKTEEGLVSFLGTTQIVEAFEQLKLGSDVELIPGESVRTGNGFNVMQFEINVYEDNPGEATKPPLPIVVSSDGESLFVEESEAA